MPITRMKLNIADTIIALESRFPHEDVARLYGESSFPVRYKNFFYAGSRGANILIKVAVVKKLPQPKIKEKLFITYHPEDKKENWHLYKKGNTYVYTCPLKGEEQVIFINRAFDRVSAYVLPKKDSGFVWNITDIIYDFLQVLLINYFSQRKSGIFVHAVGIKDLDKRGLLFAGKSGSGKSTSARIWHNQSRAMVLNDDRIIVRKHNGKFFMYGSPWHGSFNDYLSSRIESAPLSKFFFIYHSFKNTARLIPKQKVFNFLYPTIFPTFWDRALLENIISFCQDLIKNVRCFHMGFMNNKKVIGFIRRLD